MTNKLERTWDRVFKRNLEAAEEKSTDINVELEKEWPGGELWVQNYVAPYIPKDGVAVEIGAGSGRISQWVLPLTSRAYLTDYSAYACELLRSKFPEAIVLEVDDCILAGVPDESVDVVYSISVFGHLFEEQVLVYFQQAMNKLKPGGVMTIHLTDMRNDIAHFLKHTPEKVDSQRTKFRYLHPEYAIAFAEHVGFVDASTKQADSTRAYFLIATKPE